MPMGHVVWIWKEKNPSQSDFWNALKISHIANMYICTSVHVCVHPCPLPYFAWGFCTHVWRVEFHLWWCRKLTFFFFLAIVVILIIIHALLGRCLRCVLHLWYGCDSLVCFASLCRQKHSSLTKEIKRESLSEEGMFVVGWEDLSLCSALRHQAVMSFSLPWYVQRRGDPAWLCTSLICIAIEKKYLHNSSPSKLYFMCRWLVAYLASSAFNSTICVGRNVESLETPSCTVSNPEPIGWRELKRHLGLGGLVIKPVQFKMAFCSCVHPPKLRPCASAKHLSIPWCQTLPGADPLLCEVLPCPTKPRTDKLRK